VVLLPFNITMVGRVTNLFVCGRAAHSRCLYNALLHTRQTNGFLDATKEWYTAQLHMCFSIDHEYICMLAGLHIMCSEECVGSLLYAAQPRAYVTPIIESSNRQVRLQISS
jgi:hypothetical protein